MNKSKSSTNALKIGKNIDDDYTPYFEKDKKVAFKRWTKEEHLAYIEILGEIMKGEQVETTKGDRIFKKISDKVKSKDNLQCRCHHNKMLEKFNGLDGILDSSKRNLDL